VAAAAAAVLLIAQAAAPITLAGVVLGSSAKDVVAAHKGAPAGKSATGSVWSFARPGGGTIKITAGDDGNVAIVDFVAGASAAGTIDLPAAPSFALAGTHDAYSNASTYVESDACAQPASNATCYAYTLEDGSELLLTFSAAGSGLREALWGDRALLKELGLIAAGTTL